MSKAFNALYNHEGKDREFLAEIIAQICDYAVDNNLSPTMTVKIIAESLIDLLEVSDFDNWKRRTEK